MHYVRGTYDYTIYHIINHIYIDNYRCPKYLLLEHKYIYIRLRKDEILAHCDLALGSSEYKDAILPV